MIRLERSRIDLATALRRAAAALCLCVVVGNGSTLAQTPEGPPASSPDHTNQPWDWQRQQPTKERVRELLREEGIAPSSEERRSQLRDLNEIYRELMPPGAAVPAPGVVGSPARPGNRD